MAQRVWGDNPAGLEPIVIDLNKGLDTLMEGVVGPPVLLVDGDVVTVRGREDGPVMRLPDADKRRVLRRTFKGPVIDYGVDEDQIPADPRVKRPSQSGRRRRAPATTETATDHTLHNTTETSEEAGVGGLGELFDATTLLDLPPHNEDHATALAERSALADLVLGNTALPAPSSTSYEPLNAYLGTTEPAEQVFNAYFEAAAAVVEPRTWKEALQSKERDLWIEAHTEEWDNHRRHGTYTLVPRPRGKNVVKSGIVMKVKYTDGIFTRCRLHFIAKGYSQMPGVDFADRFSATAQSVTIRLIL
eukprot:2349453-Rhodomonas_salina.1